MIKEDIPIHKLDLTASDPFNKVNYAYGFRREVKNNNIVIPPSAPFYQKSLKMYDKNGVPLVEGTDYEFYGILGKLTKHTAQPVGLFVRLLKDELTEWHWDYQVVGNFNKLTNEILNMLHSIYEDDRFVLWENIENKPLWFDPEIHQHDLAYNIYGFTDLVTELKRIGHIQATQKTGAQLFLEVFQDHIDYYCASFRDLLADMIANHATKKYDNHAVRKEHIGLGLVDDFATADLEQTLEGLREDLHITPYNAGLVVAAAAGRNDKLYPSGKLPLLRYGSDTFIPPTISGSFEGIGGINRRVGALVEVDGTLLILQHRNNGKVRGLYFTRCKNWRSQDADYEFTAYMYQHPTATAAGATLDTIINGSNRYVMVVGDSVKNMWWWCATNNTFNPDRHILVRINGPWVTEDQNAWNGDFIYAPWDKAVLLADENYEETFAILQAYHQYEFMENRRKDKYPGYTATGAAWWNNSVLHNCGFSLNIISNRSTNIVRADIDFNHEVYGNFHDQYWTPWFPEVATEGGKQVIKSCTARFVNPIRQIWLYRSVHAYWLKQENGNYSFHMEQSYRDTTFAGNISGGQVVFRSTVELNKNGAAITAKITPAPSNERLYTIDADQFGGNPNTEWEAYKRDVRTYFTPNGMDLMGSAMLSGGFIHYSDGVGNSAFPSSYAVVKTEFGLDSEKMLRPGTLSNVYKNAFRRIDEVNPVGLGSLFLSQRLFIGDTDNYATGGIIARQNTTEGSNWIYRPLGSLNTQYQYVAPTQLTVYNGVPHNHYPYVPNAKKLNIGPQIVIQNIMPPATGNGKAAVTRLFAANSASMLMGQDNGPAVYNKMYGDGLWIMDASIKQTDSELTISPKVVVNLTPAIVRTLTPAMVAAGLTAQEVLASWSFGYAQSPTGAWFGIFSCFGVRGSEALSCSVVCTIAPAGTPTTVDGYQKYPDVNMVLTSPVNNSFRVAYDIVNNDIINPRYQDHPYGAGGLFMSFPYKAINNNIYDSSAFIACNFSSARVNGSGGSTPIGVILEISANGTSIQRVLRYPTQEWGTDVSPIPCPYYGIGDASVSRAIFEGAALGMGPIDRSGDFAANILSRKTVGNRVVGMSNILTPSYTIYFQSIKDMLLAGKMYSIPSTYIDLLNQDPNPANKRFYVYVYYFNGRAEYKVVPSVIPESSTQSLIAEVICGPTQIDRIIPYNRFSMNGIIISTKRQGSAILATSGSVNGVGDASTILLPGDYIPE